MVLVALVMSVMVLVVMVVIVLVVVVMTGDGIDRTGEAGVGCSGDVGGGGGGGDEDVNAGPSLASRMSLLSL